MTERELLTDIRNMLAETMGRLKRVENRLGILGGRKEIEQLVAGEKADRKCRSERGTRYAEKILGAHRN